MLDKTGRKAYNVGSLKEWKTTSESCGFLSQRLQCKSKQMNPDRNGVTVL